MRPSLLLQLYAFACSVGGIPFSFEAFDAVGKIAVGIRIGFLMEVAPSIGGPEERAATAPGSKGNPAPVPLTRQARASNPDGLSSSSSWNNAR
jgi:hypothetical protein